MLPAQLFKDLREALLDAFGNDSLSTLIRTGLDKNPDAVAGGTDLGVRIDKLITWADQQGRLLDLIDAALDVASGNPALRKVRPKIMIVTGSEHLGEGRRRALRDPLRNLGMGTHEARKELIAQLDPIVVELLPRSHNEEVQFRETLELLDRVSRTDDCPLPLRTWLEMAARRPGKPADLQVVQAAITELIRIEGGAPAIADEKLDAVVPREGKEQIVHQDDMLPFAFLQRGLEVGRSVCRLVVPMYVNGRPFCGHNEKPLHSFGSAWLLTDDLLMTNHHVVNARNPNEPQDAPLADLQLQAQHAIAQFDYDAEDSETEDIPVKELVAWSSQSGPLDYAILRLTRPAIGRRRLKLVTEQFALSNAVASRPAVNIIQHPGRHDGPTSPLTYYKKLACRNNLVFRTEGVDLWYFTDTLGGSSGSPVCNDQWNVVALHKKWSAIDKVTFQGKPTAVANVGTQIHAILEDLAARPELRGVHDEILAANAKHP